MHLSQGDYTGAVGSQFSLCIVCYMRWLRDLGTLMKIMPPSSFLPVYADMEVFGRRLSLPSQFSETERLGGEKNAGLFFF